MIAEAVYINLEEDGESGQEVDEADFSQNYRGKSSPEYIENSPHVYEDEESSQEFEENNSQECLEGQNFYENIEYLEDEFGNIEEQKYKQDEYEEEGKEYKSEYEEEKEYESDFEVEEEEYKPDVDDFSSSSQASSPQPPRKNWKYPKQPKHVAIMKKEPNKEVSSETSNPEPDKGKLKYLPRLPKDQRNKTYKQYTRSDLQAAVESVLWDEMSIVEASQRYNIPKATLKYKVSKRKDPKEVDKAKALVTEKHYKLVKDIMKLLTHTNATPFRTRAVTYYCFYCGTGGPSFDEPDELRLHTKTEHSYIHIDTVQLRMKPQWMNEVLKLDVHDLCCLVCSMPLPDWNKMFVHFAETHAMGFEEAYTKIIPYDLSTELKCALCKEKFFNFILLDGHMNLHYSNHICFECGDTFVTSARLDKHLGQHRVGSYKCELCDKVFTLDRYRAKHMQFVHREKQKVKCQHCDEEFLHTFQRHKHMEVAHLKKLKIMYCEVCNKAFTWKPYLMKHMRLQHKSVKKHQCEYCCKKFLMKYELRNHLVKHTGEKNFVCLCGQSFARAQTLRKHAQLMHSDDQSLEN